jgi:decaprenylphospho-beta-D-ribofuranose 2-oxidase
MVTIGGAIASDIHGKSHHITGTFSKNIIEITLMLASGDVIVTTPKGRFEEFFWATVGGMGLTGFIVEAKLQLERIQTSLVQQTEFKENTFESVLSRMTSIDSSFANTVAWIDLSSKARGRGIVSGANPSLPGAQRKPQPFKPKCLENKRLSIPANLEIGVIRPETIKLFNSFWFSKPLQNGLLPIRSFMHPLDRVSNWNRLYGRNGVLEYQIVVPFGEENFLSHTIEEFQRFGFNSFLTVLKRFGETGEGHLSFPIPGWTLSLDFPNPNQLLFEVIELLDTSLAKIGGRVYLTKDSVLNPRLVPVMYPRLKEWKEIRNSMDPQGVWSSNLGRRLGLV